MARELTEYIKQTLTELSANIPIEWDRYTENMGVYSIYGWIQRLDNKRDFVLVIMGIQSKLIGTERTHVAECRGFTTSSAKYSARIMSLLFPDVQAPEENICKKVIL